MQTKSPYTKIAENIDKNPLTAPKTEPGFSKAFIEYLQLVYTQEEALLVQHLEMTPRYNDAGRVAEASGMEADQVENILSRIRRKGGLVCQKGKYALPPIGLLINIHQVYSEIRPDDIQAARLYQTFFIRDGFFRFCEASEKGTPVFRTIPVHQVIKTGQKILPAEEAHEFIDSLGTDQFSLVPCSCRTRTAKLGIRECEKDNPVGYCIMLGASADYFQRLGQGRKISRQEAIQYVDDMLKLGLVAQTDNAAGNNSIICLCCECCCSQIRGRTRWNHPHAILPANFVPLADQNCIFCGQCVDTCPVRAMSLNTKTKKAEADPEKCIGCGVCAMRCPEKALWLYRHERSTPFTSMGELLRTVARENRRE